MAQPLSGRNPLSYLGVEAITPPNMIVSPVSPLPTDAKNVTIGDMWLDRNTQNFYVLTSLTGGRATWTQVEGSGATEFETDDSNIATPLGGLLKILGGSGITTSSAGDTVFITANPGGGAIVTVTGDNGNTASGSNINLLTEIFTNNYFNGTVSFNGDNATNMVLNTWDGNQNIGLGRNVFATGGPGGTIRFNTGLGWQVGMAMDGGGGPPSQGNVLMGYQAGLALTACFNNVAVGYLALSNATTPTDTIAIGNSAGVGYSGSESSNILLNANGINGENNTLRIGVATGTGNQELNQTFISGIQGIFAGASNDIVSIAGDQLGTVTLTAGSGITLTPASGTITISSSGGGTTNFFGDSGTATDGSGFLQIQTGYAGGVLDGSGTCAFDASGSRVVFIATDGTSNTIYGAGSVPNTGSPGGNDNSGFGAQCMQGSGPFSGSFNCGFGSSCLEGITSGSNNTAMGSNSGEILTSGIDNCFFGFDAGKNVTTGTRNVFIGYESGGAVISTITGSYNVEIGFEAGVNYTAAESSNININASSTTVVSENNTLRIGNGTGTGNQQLNQSFVSGINGIVVTGAAVLVSTSDQLGVASSSRRFKSDIQDMGDSSSVLQSLRPVSFTWNRDSSPGLKDAPTTRQYGLIAEEALPLVPHAVNMGDDGQPINISYENLIGMMINEIQKLRKEVDALKKGAV